MTTSKSFPRKATVKKLIEFLASSVLLKSFNHDEIIKGDKVVQNFLLEMYQDETFTFTPFLSYYIVETNAMHMMKIKTENNQITSIYIAKPQKETRYLFNVAYDGSYYQGFQRQQNKKTIQGAIESVLKHLIKDSVTIHPASRTDAHVHAHNQYFHADLNLDITLDKLKELMNKMLDDDIYIKSIETVPYVFHARYDVMFKTYAYHLHHKRNPFLSKYSTYHENLDKNKLKNILNPLLGTHDFTHFSKKNTKKTGVRTITNIMVKQEIDKTIIYITGTGFLRRMIRMIIGQALHDYDYNTNTLKAALTMDFQHIQSYSAPPYGLHLHSIAYKKSSQNF